MLDVPSSLVLEVLAQVHDSEVLFHVLLCNVPYPPGNSSRKETNLDIIFALSVHTLQDPFDIFLEAKLEHLVGFVKDNCPYVGEIDISTLDVI